MRNRLGRRLSAMLSVSAVALGALIASCGGSSSGGGGGGGDSSKTADPNASIVVALDAEPSSLDPVGNTLSLANGSIFEGLFDTLMRAPAFGEDPEPLLLESVTESADRLTWTLTVRDGVTFHDGSALDAAAVVANLERARTSPYIAPDLVNITGVTETDPKTVTVTLASPWTAFPVILSGATGLMASPASFADPASAARNPVGTGPYVFKEWVSGDRVTMTRNENYWGEPAPLAEITFKFVQDETARLTAMFAGDIDAMTTINPNSEKEAANQGIASVVPPITGYALIHLNNEVAPLDDPTVRRALDLAIDREALVDAFGLTGFDVTGYGPLTPDNRWFTDPGTAPARDLEQASALIAAYGKPVKFTVNLLQGSQESTDTVKAIVDMWNEAGADVSVEIIPDLATHVTNVLSGGYEAAAWLAGLSVDPDISFYAILHSQGASNYSNFASDAMDSAIETGRQSADEAERKSAFADVMSIFREEMPYVIISHGQIRFLVGDRMMNVVDNGFFPTRTVAATS